MKLHPVCEDALWAWMNNLMTTEQFVWLCNMVNSEQGAWAMALAETWT